MLSRFVTLAAVLAMPATASAEAAAPRVGVVIELTVGVAPGRADAIGKALADALSKKLQVDAFGGGDVSRQLPAEGLPEECLASPDCVADVAARIDADQLIFLALAQIGDELQVDASWIDVATQQVTARPRVVVGSDTTAYEEFLDHASRYLPDAPERAVTTPGGGGGPTLIQVPATPRHMTLPAWISAGASAGFLIAGAAFGLSARSTYGRCETSSCPESDLDAIDQRALLADVSFGLSAAAAVVTGFLYLRSGSPGTEVIATPTSGGAVLGLGGRW